MESFYTCSKETWNGLLIKRISEFDIYAPLLFDDQIEYSLIKDPETLPGIVYNRPKPSTPLKTFFLPIKENVVRQSDSRRKRIIMGVPACDLHALSILDEMYLDKEYTDPTYSERRNNTLLIGCDCHSFQEHCHCTAYGFKPWPQRNEDLILTGMEDQMVLEVKSRKGKDFAEQCSSLKEEVSKSTIKLLKKKREEITQQLEYSNHQLPDYEQTGILINGSEENIWNKYADTCVSCGACSAICPTCSCFLFIERPEFEKVRSLDTCQYPGFARVAAGEDPLLPLSKRFRNRYMCKYVWKPEKFESRACTGCGRCIEACIGGINKNELFRELNPKKHLSYDHSNS